VVGVYFSASWCGPCKQFTPQLEKFYEEMRKKGHKFEIIWVSRDRSQDEFVDYYLHMPWLAVTLGNIPEVIERLAPKYGMKGVSSHLIRLVAAPVSMIDD
jgi:nucleoredoxin